ncbi:DEKNAAC101226 [Brettanomyces naardenensis]|uniref:DEKNAAC101226 n=1 Tax=Brettanomyces naardenensis TaxID=13370 RepID=A0A448YH71_BRENA|nr:DEKNAAC101226 [Brettanomyces naardenensis]
MSSLYKEITLPNGVKYSQPVGLFINNEWKSSSKTFETLNPSTEESIASVYEASAEDVDLAVSAAKQAMKTWKDVPGEEKARKILKLAELLESKLDLFAAVEAMDSGKPLETNSKPDIQSVASYLIYCAGFSDKLHGKVIPIDKDRYAITKRYPLVVGQIIPWNYPLSMASWKFCPALACGCTIVIKSSELTPLSLLLFADLVKEAGFPPGVFNVISGFGAVAGNRIAEHPDLDKVAFTGSTVTGQKVMKAAAGNLKHVSLECGGKSPLLVFDDADLDQAAKWAAFGVMYNSGQNCTANSRILVQDNVYDKFLQLFTAELKKSWIVGDPFGKKTTLGPVISKGQYDKIRNYIKKGKEEGAVLILGEDDEQLKSLPKKGFFIPPTVFKDCQQKMTIVQEEIFGPVVAVSKFSADSEAIEKANDSIYGLAAMVFSQNFGRIQSVADKLEAGSIYLNSSNDEDLRVPFGGFKMSGIGKELGEAVIELYTETKSFYMNVSHKL